MHMVNQEVPHTLELVGFVEIEPGTDYGCWDTAVNRDDVWTIGKVGFGVSSKGNVIGPGYVKGEEATYSNIKKSNSSGIASVISDHP
jgi:hypothetical protein